MAYWKQKRRIMKRYDRSAHAYDAQYFEEQQTKIRTALTEIHLEKTDVVIDVGCGTGQLLPHITTMVKLIVCIDISSNLIRQAKTRTLNAKNIALLRADADHLPLRPHKFDVAFAITLLQNMPRPIQTLVEMKRVTKEKANLIVTGLRKSFDEQHFTQLLKQTGLAINSLELDDAQREYVAVCVNIEENLNRTLKAL